MKTPDTTDQRKRRSLLVLPLLVLPFLTLAFWALGGGQAADQGADNAKPKGLSLQLPEPRLDTPKELTKLRLYQDAGRQASASGTGDSPALWDRLGFSDAKASALLNPGTAPGLAVSLDTQEAKVNERLSQLSQLLDRPRDGVASTGSRPAPLEGMRKMDAAPVRVSQDVARLETLLHTLGNRQAGQATDPQLQQLEGMLERILDIQHPERVKSRLQEQEGKEEARAFTLTSQPAQGSLTLLEPETVRSPLPSDAGQYAPESLPGFYGLPGSRPLGTTEAGGNTLAAAIDETQTVVSGGIVRLRLLQEASLAGSLLPKGSLLYGTCRVAGERLLIEVNSVQAGPSILPVSLAAFDLDGLEGLYTPGSITREAGRQGANRLLGQSLFPPLSPSLGAQAAGVGLTAAQGLLSRQARQVRITLKAGHQLLLRDRRLQPKTE